MAFKLVPGPDGFFTLAGHQFVRLVADSASPILLPTGYITSYYWAAR